MKNFFIFVIITFTINVTATGQNNDNDSVPVRISYLNAGQDNNKTRLNWKVVCYLNFANFEVQKSTNGVDYLTISSFTADRIRCQSPFDYKDAVASGRTYYRLKVGDRDGNFSTSKIVETFGKELSFSINIIVPSIVETNTVLEISSATTNYANIAVTNLQGVLFKQFKYPLVRGLTLVRLNMIDLSKGSYIITIYNSSLERRTARFLKL